MASTSAKLTGPIYPRAHTTYEKLASYDEEKLLSVWQHGHYGALRDAALGELQRRGLKPYGTKQYIDAREGRRPTLTWDPYRLQYYYTNVDGNAVYV